MKIKDSLLMSIPIVKRFGAKIYEVHFLGQISTFWDKHKVCVLIFVILTPKNLNLACFCAFCYIVFVYYPFMGLTCRMGEEKGNIWI